MTNGSARIELDDGAPVELLGRHVLVTGASRGIGAAIAREMARGGARVALVSRRLEHAEAARAALPHPERHAAFAADVTIERAAGELVARVEAAGGPLFALVNNVGRGEAVGFVEAGESHWREMIDANLMSAVFCTRAALGGMRARHEGRIVNVASTASLRGYRYVSAYTAAKHALLIKSVSARQRPRRLPARR